jgi:sec-independent protein translocase protein TatA
MWTPSATEILIILGIVVLLFGGRKLPELARGSGRALRIFKSEVKGLQDDEDDTKPEALESTEAEKKPEQG